MKSATFMNPFRSAETPSAVTKSLKVLRSCFASASLTLFSFAMRAFSVAALDAACAKAGAAQPRTRNAIARALERIVVHPPHKIERGFWQFWPTGVKPGSDPDRARRARLAP